MTVIEGFCGGKFRGTAKRAGSPAPAFPEDRDIRELETRTTARYSSTRERTKNVATWSIDCFSDNPSHSLFSVSLATFADIS